MNKGLERHMNRITDGSCFGQCQLACHHQLREAQRLEETRFLGRADIALRAGMQGDGRQVQAQESHILHYQGIDAGMVELANQAFHLGQLIVVNDGVDRGINTGAIGMSEIAHPGHVGNGIGGGHTCAKARGAHIYGIGTMLDGLDGHLGIARRGQ